MFIFLRDQAPLLLSLREQLFNFERIFNFLREQAYCTCVFDIFEINRNAPSSWTRILDSGPPDPRESSFESFEGTPRILREPPGS